MELWKSDGTSAGTIMVKDINPGPANSGIGYLTNVNNVLFFVANDGINGSELWKSDGTAAGTAMVKDIRPGIMGSNPSYLVNVNGILFFASDNGVDGAELWRSDGTDGGTFEVKDINPNSGSATPESLADVNGTLFFSADDGINGPELWKSDGTAAGTSMVKDIWPGADGAYPSDLVNAAGTLFFSANDGTYGTELWKSDGSATGTVLVKDILPGIADSYPFNLKSVNGVLFFSADNGLNGSELWKTSGTETTTVLVKDVWPGIESGAVGNFSTLINRLIFTGNDGVNGFKTWQSDGSNPGTTIVSGIADPGNGSMTELVETPDHVFASVFEETTGRELWGSNFASILPVTWIEFRGQLDGADAVLHWKTGNEINTDKFIVERSLNGNSFTQIGTVTSANAPGVHTYSFTDRNVSFSPAGVVYYRLKQSNADGRFSYSVVITLSKGKAPGSVTIYPNPAHNEVNLSITSSRNEKIRWTVIDAAGKLVQQDTKELMTGNSIFIINTDKLPGGVYYISLHGSTTSKELKFIKE